MTKHSTTTSTNETLILSGLTELATGALTGWPYALAISDADKLRKLGIRLACSPGVLTVQAAVLCSASPASSQV